MRSVGRSQETPKERLKQIARYSLGQPREVVAPNYLIAVALLVLIFIMLTVVFLGGTAAMEIMRVHVEQIRQFTSR